MDASDRPTKLRKLSHGEEGTRTYAESGNAGGTSCPVIPADHNNHRNETLGSNDHDTTANQAASTEFQVDKSSAAIDYPAESTQKLSKNQLKKLRKKEEWEAGKAWRKARHKEKDAEKKARKREQQEREAEERKAQGLDTNGQPQKPRWRKPVRLPITFIIDCGFDDKMAEKERISLGSQVTRSYSDNSRAPFQAHLMVTSWGGLLKERFDTVLNKNYRRWRGIHFIEEDFVAGAQKAKEFMTGSNGGRLVGAFEQYAPKSEVTETIKTEPAKFTPEQLKDEANGHAVAEQQVAADQTVAANTADQPVVTETPTDRDNNTPPATKQTSPPKPQPNDSTSTNQLKQQGETVYLTSDSPHTLTTLNPYSTYIIGGLVDKNRHKGICYKTACERGIKTAKLPIGQYMEMQSRFVLATNHVVEIMIRWLECGDWGEAFMRVIPKRKGGKLRDGLDRSVVGAGSSRDDDDDDEEEDVDDGDDVEDTLIQVEDMDHEQDGSPVEAHDESDAIS